MIVESKVVVEVKTARAIDPTQCAQLRNYLRASSLEVGLLLNFGPSAEFKRMLSTRRATGG
jgi:GxxExxY protein